MGKPHSRIANHTKWARYHTRTCRYVRPRGQENNAGCKHARRKRRSRDRGYGRDVYYDSKPRVGCLQLHGARDVSVKPPGYDTRPVGVGHRVAIQHDTTQRPSAPRKHT